MSQTDSRFEAWWAEFWDPLSGPEVTNLMFKEVAQSAWEASKQENAPPPSERRIEGNWSATSLGLG